MSIPLPSDTFFDEVQIVPFHRKPRRCVIGHIAVEVVYIFLFQIIRKGRVQIMLGVRKTLQRIIFERICNEDPLENTYKNDGQEV